MFAVSAPGNFQYCYLLLTCPNNTARIYGSDSPEYGYKWAESRLSASVHGSMNNQPVQT